MGLLTHSGDIYLWRGAIEENDAPREAGFTWDPELRRWTTRDRDRAATLWRHSLPPLRWELRPPPPEQPRKVSESETIRTPEPRVKSARPKKPRPRKCGAVFQDGKALPFLHSWGGIIMPCTVCGVAAPMHLPEVDGEQRPSCEACCVCCGGK